MTNQVEILDSPNYLPILDHGFVGIKDVMGDDAAIVQAARVSYGAGTKTVNKDRGLLRYLLRMQHSSPFEMVELKFHVRAPIFVARQWFRHRTGVYNEVSARYSEMENEFYIPIPEDIKAQATDNKQGRDGELSEHDRNGVRTTMEISYSNSLAGYHTLLGERTKEVDDWYDPYGNDPWFTPEFSGVARELARTIMPVGAYTEFYFKTNLRNLFNFLRLRAEGHAQYEIRVYAEAILKLVEPRFPLSIEAFTDYIHGALTISKMERVLLKDLLAVPQSLGGNLSNDGSSQSEYVLKDWIANAGGVPNFALSRGFSTREFREFADNFGLQKALV